MKKKQDVVMTIGSQEVIHGEYLGQGGLIDNRKTRLFVMLVMFVISMVLMPIQAMAAIDVSGALTTFGEVNTAIPIVGAAFLLALGILAAWKLIRGAFA